jgi:amidase
VPELVKRSAAALAAAIRSKEVSAVEVVDAFAARIEARNPDVNAIVVLRLDEAREEARAADVRLARGGDCGPLHGVPYTAKEVIPVAGLPATNGTLLQADLVADRDAVAVRRMRDAGAILLGKTNLSELSLFWNSVNLVYGATSNPHDATRTAGGSSGGEAAALAASLSPVGIGSDLSGSIRAPAHWNGVFGLKVSRDAIPVPAHPPLPLAAGMQAFASLGPMGRHVDDLELALAAMAEPRVPAADVGRVAVFEEDGLQPVSRACRRAVRRAVAALGEAGISVVPDAPPRPAELRGAFDTILGHEIAVGAGPLLARAEVELMPYITELIEAGRGFLPSFDAYLAAWLLVGEIDAEAQAWLARHPVALCPVSPDVAPPLDAFSFPPTVDGEPTRPGGKLSLCTYASALGLPAVAVPVGLSAEGLPVGVQLIGRRGEERTLLAVARILEDALGGWLDPDDASGSRALG